MHQYVLHMSCPLLRRRSSWGSVPCMLWCKQRIAQTKFCTQTDKQWEQ
ncbi:hypothetical protein M3J09_009297 [Ascochyta lentis]